jgi:hypothetical protein
MATGESGPSGTDGFAGADDSDPPLAGTGDGAVATEG